MKNKCVYIHFLDSTPIYVGSGNLNRCKDKAGRSEEHLSLFNNPHFKIYIVASELSKDESLMLEQGIVNTYLRKGYTLINKSLKIHRVIKKDYSKVHKYVKYNNLLDTKLEWIVDRYCGRGRLRAEKGSPAGSIPSREYSHISINGEKFLTHLVVWYLHNGFVPDESVIDHIDRNKSNNDISNLRCVSRSINSKNKLHRGSNTGYQSISESIRTKDSCFTLSWQDSSSGLIVRNKKSFYYGPKSRTREDALKLALNLRQELIEQNLIVLT